MKRSPLAMFQEWQLQRSTHEGEPRDRRRRDRRSVVVGPPCWKNWKIINPRASAHVRADGVGQPLLDIETRRHPGAQAPLALSKEDFAGLSAVVDAYLSDHVKLHGVLVHAKGFPGWESFGGFTAHMHFVREHHKLVERIAVVTDSHFAGIAEALGKHFTSADFRHFPFSDDVKALEWLKTA